MARFMFVPSGPGANWELVAAVGSVFVPLGRVRPGIYLLWSVLCLRRLGRVKLGSFCVCSVGPGATWDSVAVVGLGLFGPGASVDLGQQPYTLQPSD